MYIRKHVPYICVHVRVHYATTCDSYDASHARTHAPFRSTIVRIDDALGERLVLERRQAEVADLHGAGGAGDEDVVALEVAVDDGRRARV